jgi:carbon monoxide dehydrogenase subunit G
MKFTGELVVRAPREAVFDKLKDAPFFASCVEGVRDLKEVTPTHYTAVFETKIAYIKFKFEVAVEMTVADRPNAIAAKIEGKHRRTAVGDLVCELRR